MKKTTIILTRLAIFFSFFDGFIIPFGVKSFVRCYVFVILLLFILYFSKILYNPSILINKIKFLCKKTPFKYFLYFIIWLFLDTVILIFTGKATWLIFYYILFKLFLPAFMCYFISALFIPKYLSIKDSIKVLYVFTISAIFISLVGYIGDGYNISFIKSFINTFSNLKSVLQNVDIMVDSINGSARARGFFHEPSAFSNFILLFSPIMYKICLSKFKIFKNNVFNKIVKSSIIPLSLLCVILTKSPIYTLFMLIFIASYFYKQIITFLVKFFVPILVLILIGFSIFQIGINVSFEKTYMYRVVGTVSSMRNFDDFINVEPSLASRVVSYINSSILFLKKPIIGYGFDNARFYMLQQYQNSPVPLTKENLSSIYEALTSNMGIGFNKSLLSGLLVETGLIGTFLYLLFLYMHIKYIDCLKPYFFGVERKFLEGLKISIIIVLITCFYNACFAMAYVYLFYGFVCSFVTQCDENCRKGRYLQ